VSEIACCSECYEAPCECHTKNFVAMNALRAQLAVEREKVRTLTEERDYFRGRLAHDTEKWLECIGERDEARALALSYRNGEVITEGIARLVDAQTASLKGKLDEARASRHALAMRVAERVKKWCWDYSQRGERVIRDAGVIQEMCESLDPAALVAECEASHG